jgi:hypothetical protein
MTRLSQPPSLLLQMLLLLAVLVLVQLTALAHPRGMLPHAVPARKALQVVVVLLARGCQQQR